MIETLLGIKEWADTVFGDVSLEINLARANEELAELITQCVRKKPLKDIAEECADIAIVLVRSVYITSETSIPEFNFNISERYLISKSDEHSIAIIYGLSIHRHLHRCMSKDDTFSVMSARLDNIYNLLECICVALGTTLAIEIDAKMVINRARKWNITGQGTGYHVK